MTDTFHLSHDPWLPCELPDGRLVLRSTREALVQAHELRGLVLDPLESAAVHRHLLAVVHRVVDGPASKEDWVGIWSAGRFDEEAVDAYLDSVRERMDLFHPSEPFAQVRGLAAKGFNVDPIDKLGFERSKWGGARALFQHRTVGYRARMTPAEAARALLAHHAFATGGLVKKPKEPTSATAAPLVRSAVVLVRGATLFETLVLNLLEYDPEDDEPIATSGERDLPAWEQPPQRVHLHMMKKEPQRLPLGWLDLLTWEARRLELIREGDDVSGFVRAVGRGLAADPPRDPMVAHRQTDKRGWITIGLDPKRMFWREANALFSAAAISDCKDQRPKALDLLSSPEALDAIGGDATLDLDVLGLSAEKSRLDLIRAEHLRARARLFSDGVAATEVAIAIDEKATVAVGALRAALVKYAAVALSPGDRTPDSKEVYRLVDSWGATTEAWSALGEHFDALLRDLGEVEPEEARERFAQACLRVAQACFAAATAAGRESGRWLKAAALGERVLHAKLRPLRTSLRAPESSSRAETNALEGQA